MRITCVTVTSPTKYRLRRAPFVGVSLSLWNAVYRLNSAVVLFRKK